MRPAVGTFLRRPGTAPLYSGARYLLGQGADFYGVWAP